MRRSRRGTSIGTILLVLLLIGAYYVLRGGGSSSPASTNGPGVPVAGATSVQNGVPNGVPSGVPNWGKPSKTSGCTVNGALQDPACTPGDIIPNVTKADICKSGYASSVRNVPDSEKNQDYAEYGIKSHTSGQYEVDHLVSLELGGSNDISNLWP
jgi:hypothetical protein